MIATLSPQGRRALALGLLALALAVAYAAVIRPIVGAFAEQRAAIEEQTELLRRYRGLAAERATLEARLERLRSRPASQGLYLAGDNENLVAAQLQSRIKSIVSETRAKLASSQVLPSADEKGFRRVGIRLTMTGGIVDLRDILFRLESGRPYLFLDNVDVSSVQGLRTAGEAGDLNITLDVFGYIRTS